jgi:hypothetical protein
LKPPLFKQLDHPAGDCLDCLGIEFDARGWHPDSTVQGGGPLHRLTPEKGVPSVSCSWGGGWKGGMSGFGRWPLLGTRRLVGLAVGVLLLL